MSRRISVSGESVQIAPSTPRESDNGAPTGTTSRSVRDTVLRLEPGATVCFVSPDNQLMAARRTSTSRELSLIPVTSVGSVQASSSKKIQHYSADSVFVVGMQVILYSLLVCTCLCPLTCVPRQECLKSVQGSDLTFASVGAGGQLLQTRKDKHNSLRVHGHSATRAATWKLSGNVLMNAATEVELGMTPKLVHAFSVDEMRDLEKQYSRSDREQSAKVWL